MKLGIHYSQSTINMLRCRCIRSGSLPSVALYLYNSTANINNKNNKTNS